MKLFSTEQVSKFHPDKYADQISDAILDHCLKWDENARVAVETLVKGTTVVVAGEITAYPVTKESIEQVVRRVAKKLNYEVTEVINLVEAQSPEIAKAVNTEEGIAAGDQGMMFGYATNESNSLLPWGFDLANRVISIIEDDVDYNPNTILKGDAKTQVTVDFDAPTIEGSLHTLLISACHKEGYTLAEVREYIESLLKVNDIPAPSHALIINPAGTWTVGGPIADAGLTGRKIVCDQYGGFVPVGGGAFSGKDPSKVDRSGAYMARYLATKALYKFSEVGMDWIQIQIAYAIGVKEPVSVAFTTNVRDKDILEDIQIFLDGFDLTPSGIINHLQLVDNPNYERRAEGCHYYLHMKKDELE